MSPEDEAVKVARELYAQGTRDLLTLTAKTSERVSGRAKLYAATGARKAIQEGTGQSAGQVLATGLGSDDPSKYENPIGGVTDAVKAVGDLPGVIREAVDLPTRILKWLGEPGTWVRIAYVVGGGVMLLVSVAIVAKGAASTAAGSTVGKVIRGK